MPRGLLPKPRAAPAPIALIIITGRATLGFGSEATLYVYKVDLYFRAGKLHLMNADLIVLRCHVWKKPTKELRTPGWASP